jgi:fluoride exporter
VTTAGQFRPRVTAMREANRLLVIGVGGAFGALSRAGISQLFGTTPIELGDQSASFPWATLTVNVIGALLIGILAVALIADGDSYLRPFLITGFLGGFTTFSALALDTVDLMDNKMWPTALLYLAITVGAGLIAVQFGIRVTRRMVKS